MPASVHRATVPAAPKSTSSGWAVMDQDPGDIGVVEHVRHPNRAPGRVARGPPGPIRPRHGRHLSERAVVSRPRPSQSLSSGTRVGVARVRVCFLKNAGAVTRM